MSPITIKVLSMILFFRIYYSSLVHTHNFIHFPSRYVVTAHWVLFNSKGRTGGRVADCLYPKVPQALAQGSEVSFDVQGPLSRVQGSLLVGGRTQTL